MISLFLGINVIFDMSKSVDEHQTYKPKMGKLGRFYVNGFQKTFRRNHSFLAIIDNKKLGFYKKVNFLKPAHFLMDS
jgi:hypothetical protein